MHRDCEVCRAEGFAAFSGLWYMQLILRDNEKYFKHLDDWRKELLGLKNAPPLGIGSRVGDANPAAYAPIVIERPPYDVRTRGEQLLQQDFMQMRRTSPDPNNFLGGQYNPRFQTIYPRPYQYYNPFPYYGGGGYFPYPSYGYPYYGGYGSGYGYPPAVQQEVYIFQPPRTESGGGLRPVGRIDRARRERF